VWVHGDLVLGRVSNETLGVGEGNERGGGAVTLVVGDNLDAIIAVDTNTGVGGTQINSDGWSHFECSVVVRVKFEVDLKFGKKTNATGVSKRSKKRRFDRECVNEVRRELLGVEKYLLYQKWLLGVA